RKWHNRLPPTPAGCALRLSTWTSAEYHLHMLDVCIAVSPPVYQQTHTHIASLLDAVQLLRSCRVPNHERLTPMARVLGLLFLHEFAFSRDFALHMWPAHQTLVRFVGVTHVSTSKALEHPFVCLAVATHPLVEKLSRIRQGWMVNHHASTR